MNQPNYFSLPAAETGVNITPRGTPNAIALAACEGWLALHAGPLSLMLGDDCLTLRSKPVSDVPEPADDGEGTGETRRTNRKSAARLDQALRRAVRNDAVVIVRTNGDRTFAAPVAVVLDRFLEYRHDLGLSIKLLARQTDWRRGLSAALASGTVESIECDGGVYLRPSWVPTNSSRVLN
jgi:hypothetical protein